VANTSASDLWNNACRHLNDVLHRDVYSRWISIIEPVELEQNTLTLAVDNDFYQSWLEEHYLPLISNATRTAADAEIGVRFVVRASSKTEAASAPTPLKKKTIRERLTKRSTPPTLNPKFTFDEFIVGSSNTFAHAAALAVAQAPARAYNPLFIYGGVGLGKTHLMEAIGHHVIATSSRANVCYLSSEAFLNEYIDALQSRALVQFRKKYRNTDLLLIDDIHFLASKERIQEEFFHTFNVLFDARKQIVMTSDRPASEIAGLEKRLVSRFEWGLVTELQPPDLETRIAILRHKQDQATLRLSDELLSFIAENVRSNIRRLEGALIRTISYMSLTGKDLSIDSLRHLLRDMIEREQHTEITFASIQRAVAEHYDVRISDMSSKCRQRAIAMPRQVAMYLCRRMTRSSLPDIANAFGKTHATVLHAYRAIENHLETDDKLRQDLDNISRKLGHTVSCR